MLGTSFNVRLADDDGAEVAVVTGIVQVANAGESPAISLQLQPGDWARLGRAGAVERGTVQADEVAPWLHGQIVARDRAMADVIDELRRYYRGMIVVADDSLARPPRHRRLQSRRSEGGLERDRRRTRRVGAAGVALVAGRPRQLTKKIDASAFRAKNRTPPSSPD